MKIYKRILLLLLLGVLLALFVLSTDPNDLALGMLLVPFVLLGCIIFNLIRLFMSLFRYSAQNQTRQRAVAILFSVIFTNFAVLQSIGRLTIQDVILAAAITALVALYITRFQTPS